MREIRMSGLTRGRGGASLPTLPVNNSAYSALMNEKVAQAIGMGYKHAKGPSKQGLKIYPPKDLYQVLQAHLGVSYPKILDTGLWILDRIHTNLSVCPSLALAGYGPGRLGFNGE
jgi:hypothetical protein